MTGFNMYLIILYGRLILSILSFLELLCKAGGQLFKNHTFLKLGSQLST